MKQKAQLLLCRGGLSDYMKTVTFGAFIYPRKVISKVSMTVCSALSSSTGVIGCCAIKWISNVNHVCIFRLDLCPFIVIQYLYLMSPPPRLHLHLTHPGPSGEARLTMSPQKNPSVLTQERKTSQQRQLHTGTPINTLNHLINPPCGDRLSAEPPVQTWTWPKGQ